MSNPTVVEFTGTTSLPIDPDQVLDRAKGEYKTVLVIGIHKETGDIDCRGSEGGPCEANMLLDRAKQFMIDIESYDHD